LEQDIRLVYAAASNQVRVSFSTELVSEERKPPKDLYKRAKAKLEDEQSKGNIEAFVLYENSFNLFWSHLREQEDLANKTASFCIALGYRNYKDLQVQQQTSDAKNWTMTIKSNPEALGKIGWPRFCGFIQKNMGLEPFSQPLLQVRILENYWRAMRGEQVQNRLMPPVPLDEDLPPIKFFQDKSTGTILVWIKNPELVQTQGQKQLFIQIQNFLEKNKASLSDYNSLLKECQVYMRELSAMPESFGFGLPFGLPIAVKSMVAKESKQEPAVATVKDVFKSTRSQARPSVKATKTADKLIEIVVSSDQQQAHIQSAHDTKLQSGAYDKDQKWLELAIHEAGIRYGFEMYLEKVMTLIALGQTIKGQIIARGVPPQAGGPTYLHPLFMDKTIDEQEEVIDLRSSQNRLMVEKGDVIAEIRFRDSKSGMDVLGRKIFATALKATYTIEPGPGVERREDGKYYATISGMPKIERHAVSCLQVYVHRGDINLKSGDINFDGTVEVKGSIDNGARVSAKGDLIVRGSIGRSRIHCGGDLSVANGIVTSREGMVHVKGDVRALFIENSRIIVEGELGVEQSIINSDCKVAGEIFTKSAAKGLIGGGVVLSETGIRTLDLGFQDGEKTICRVGSDWRLENRLTILRVREAKLKKFVNDRQYEFEDMSKKKLAVERIQKVEIRLARSKKILEQIEKIMEVTRSKIRWNDRAIMIVKGTIDSNVEVSIGGRVVGVPRPLKEVMFTAIRYRDQYVNSLIYLEQYNKSRKGEDAAS
jgi:uncharacterized protein (DUF342 family)